MMKSFFFFFDVFMRGSIIWTWFNNNLLYFAPNKYRRFPTNNIYSIFISARCF